MIRVILVTGVILGALIVPLGANPAAAQDNSAMQVIGLVNSYRASLGLPPFAVEPSLMAAAQGHADWMARTQTFGHTGEGGTTPTQRARLAGYTGSLVYENWVSGTGYTPTEAIVWWDNSPVHQATLQLPTHDHVGVGVANNGGQPIYVLMAGKSVPVKPTAEPDAETSEDGEAVASSDEPPTPVPVVVIPVTRADPQTDGSIIHTVQQGQTAWTIAAVYGVELAYLREINQFPPNALLRPGDQVIVQLGAGQSPPLSGRKHTVLEGETAWTVAAYYGLTLDELLDLNEIDRGTVLVPGDELLIRAPEPTWTPAPTATPTEPPPREPPTLAPTRLPTETAVPVFTVTPVLAEVASAPTDTPTPETLAVASAPEVASVESASEDGASSNVILALLIGGAGMIMLAGAIGLMIGLRRE